MHYRFSIAYFLLIPLVSAVVLFSIAMFNRIPNADQNIDQPYSTSTSTRVSLTIHGKPLFIEIVSTQKSRERGLGGRTSMPADAGMLFVFPESDRYAFWMKDMHFPLDIIWIDHGTVVDRATLDPPARASDPATTYTPTKPADRVLELNKGQADAYGLTIGTKAEVP